MDKPLIEAMKDADLRALKSEIAQARRKVLAFCHIHKTGGTTIQRMLQDNFTSHAYRVSTENELSSFEARVAAGELDADGTYLVFGHRAHLALPLLRGSIPTYAVTIIRRPFALFESMYSFQHTRQGNTGLTTAEAFARYKPNRIAGFLGAEDLEGCIRRATRDYVLVGITERLDEMAGILCYLFDLAAVEYESRNVTRPASYVEADLAILPEFLAVHELDRRIYDFFDAVAARLFRQYQTIAEGAGVSFFSGENTFNRAIRKNRNLDENNDKFSLLITGQDLWAEDPQRAIAFFDKSFAKDWAQAQGIIAFLAQADPDQARAWGTRALGVLDGQGTAAAELMQRRIRKWIEAGSERVDGGK